MNERQNSVFFSSFPALALLLFLSLSFRSPFRFRNVFLFVRNFDWSETTSLIEIDHQQCFFFLLLLFYHFSFLFFSWSLFASFFINNFSFYLVSFFKFSLLCHSSQIVSLFFFFYPFSHFLHTSHQKSLLHSFFTVKSSNQRRFPPPKNYYQASKPSFLNNLIISLMLSSC